MNTNKIFLASLAVITLLTGCVLTDGKSKEIKIGLMAPLSGDVASYGESVKKAAELALKETGLNNIKLVVEDSKCTGKDAASAITKLATIDKVVAVVGELCSDATLAAAPMAESNKVVMISPASTNPKISGAGAYIYRTIPSDDLQGSYGAQLLYNKGYKKVGILYTNESYGQGFTKVLKDSFTKLGGTVVASEAVERGAIEVKTQVSKVKSANPEVVYIISNSNQTSVAILKSITELKMNVKMYASEGLKSDSIIDGVKKAAEGLIVTMPSGGSAAYLAKYKAEYNANTGPFSAQAYDAMMVIGQAFKNGATTGEEIKKQLDTMEFNGATGKVKFDSNGDVTGGFDLYEVKNGKFVQVQ